MFIFSTVCEKKSLIILLNTTFKLFWYTVFIIYSTFKFKFFWYCPMYLGSYRCHVMECCHVVWVKAIMSKFKKAIPLCIKYTWDPFTAISSQNCTQRLFILLLFSLCSQNPIWIHQNRFVFFLQNRKKKRLRWLAKLQNIKIQSCT